MQTYTYMLSKFHPRSNSLIRDLLFGAYHNLPIGLGTPIFEKEWEILVILDGCRPDLMNQVSDEYDFLPSNIPTTLSLASCSSAWMEKNFTSKYRDSMSRTAYLTGNPYSDSYCSPSDFEFLDEVWRYSWDEKKGSVPARAMTDRTISTARKRSCEKILIHYMQPHLPSFPDPIGSKIELDKFGEEWASAWHELESGNLNCDEVWNSYRSNLQYVLDDIELLLNNINANRLVLSADHGNAFGEWGLYGHPINKPAPVLRRVPWVEIEASDERTYTPSSEDSNYKQSEPSRVEDRLEDLGYL